MNADAEILSILQRSLPEKAGPYNLHEPAISGDEKARVMEALDEGMVSYIGRHVGLFEKALAERCGVREAIATVSGTAALHAMLQVAGIGDGDEVLCPALTFAATANAIAYTGATPHFVDSTPDDLGIDAGRLDGYLNRLATVNNGRPVNRVTGRRIAAVIPVHIFGHFGDMAGLRHVAGRWGIPVLEDAAEALGSLGKDGGKPGAAGPMAALSFNGNKIVTTGGGGAILTNDPALAHQLKHITTTAKQNHPWHYMHDKVGFNYRLPNINAALGLAQVERLDEFLSQKRRLAQKYAAVFADAQHWQFFHEPAGCFSNFWLNAVMLAKPDMPLLETALGKLHAAGYRCRPCWTPMHLLPVYSGCPRDDLPVAESMAARILCLPSSPHLAEIVS